MDTAKKRKINSNNDGKSCKRPKLSSVAPSRPVKVTPTPIPATDKTGPTVLPEDVAESSITQKETTEHPHTKGKTNAMSISIEVPNETIQIASTKPRRRVNKLVPPRPYPSVPTSVSATGPRSAHNEGKNLICLTRKTPLGAYLRRCKDVILKDGYEILPHALVVIILTHDEGTKPCT